jgi:hypothetical protein
MIRKGTGSSHLSKFKDPTLVANNATKDGAPGDGMENPWMNRQAASRTDKIFPAGSLNQAMVGPLPREMPRASVFKCGSL